MSFQRPLRATWVNCPRSCSPTQHFAACSETLIGDRVSNSAPPIKIRLSERGSLDAPSSGQARFGNRCARRAATRPKLIQRRLLSMLKFGPVPPSGDRLLCRFQPASSLFSYEAKLNRMQDPRILKKVFTHNNVRPPYVITGRSDTPKQCTTGRMAARTVVTRRAACSGPARSFRCVPRSWLLAH